MAPDRKHCRRIEAGSAHIPPVRSLPNLPTSTEKEAHHVRTQRLGGTPHRLGTTHTRGLAAAAGIVVTAGVAAVGLATSASAASGCQVAYTTNTWSGGFTANIAITNLGSPVTDWTLGFTLPGGETVGQGWSATFSQ